MKNNRLYFKLIYTILLVLSFVFFNTSTIFASAAFISAGFDLNLNTSVFENLNLNTFINGISNKFDGLISEIPNLNPNIIKAPPKSAKSIVNAKTQPRLAALTTSAFSLDIFKAPLRQIQKIFQNVSLVGEKQDSNTVLNENESNIEIDSSTNPTDPVTKYKDAGNTNNKIQTTDSSKISNKLILDFENHIKLLEDSFVEVLSILDSLSESVSKQSQSPIINTGQLLNPGQPLTLTQPSIIPTVTSGFDSLSANNLNLKNNATVSGSLTVSSGGTFNSLTISGGNFSAGTTTLSKLTVSGDSSFANASTTLATLPTFWGTTGTITNASTTYLTVSGSAFLASSTMNGFNICTSANGVCSGGSGTVNSGTTGWLPYYAANGTTLTATSTLFISTASNVGIGTTTPSVPLHIRRALNDGTGLYVDSTLSGALIAINGSDASQRTGFNIKGAGTDLWTFGNGAGGGF